eukprot:scaffold2482_cov166-Amphora_coffeaeformis.AAC.3
MVSIAFNYLFDTNKRSVSLSLRRYLFRGIQDTWMEAVLSSRVPYILFRRPHLGCHRVYGNGVSSRDRKFAIHPT